MSLGQTASQQPQSAPTPQLAAEPQSPPLAPASNGNAPQSPPSEDAAPRGMGDNGGPDWRAMLAGDDTKAMEQLARYQTPGDLWKSHTELRAKLSERATPARLPDNATPVQVAEYRKGLGIPDVPTDAAPQAFADAYKIAPPKGYELSEMESGMIGDFAKTAYEKGWSPAEVKGATDFFFQQQAASQQAVNRIAVDRQKEWQAALRDEMGSREYDAQTAAASEWLKAQFDGDENGYIELTRAQLPGGGYLGDHPWFVKTVAKLAMGDGYTDRIEANTMESGGRSLAEQHRDLENLMYTNRDAYNEAAKPGGKLDKIIALRQSRGEIDDMGNDIKRKRA